jgi:hypothetical protein
MAGAALGCLAVVLVCMILGIGLLLLFTPFGMMLVVSALMVAGIVTVSARLCPWPLAMRTILLVSACLTVVVFVAFPLYLLMRNRGRGGTGPMFG